MTEQKQGAVSARSILGVSAAIRGCLIAYAALHDAAYNLKYTDIDYNVYSYGAKGMLARSAIPIVDRLGHDSFLTEPSPYLRSTYRYTPLMAIMTLPNEAVGDWFGKAAFALFDVVTGIMIHRIMQLRQVKPRVSITLLLLWVLNPLVAQVSTRGNADALITLLVTSMLYFCLKNSASMAGLCLGTAVHLKIFPAIYAVPMLFVFDPTMTWQSFVHMLGSLISPINIADKSAKRVMQQTLRLATELLVMPIMIPLSLARRLNRQQWTFGLVAFLIFATLTVACYLKYGYVFLYEAYLYHLVRHDHRHNLSPFSAWSTLVTPRRPGGTELPFPYNRQAMKSLVKFAQLPLTFTTGFWFIRSAPEVSLFLQTLIFVTFNSVSTAQYYVWYWALLPLALARMPAAEAGGKKFWSFMVWIVVISAFWYTTLLFWVFWGYQLEFRGRPEAFMGCFVCSWAFAFVNVFLANFTIYSYTQPEIKTD